MMIDSISFVGGRVLIMGDVIVSFCFHISLAVAIFAILFNARVVLCAVCSFMCTNFVF